ncbi:MAG: haloacid dehalogenase-like hydrolase [Bacteroidales bacterium]|nr:haloacid dehalogenase-like hydrolase [Bacteroidales bacterium]
MKPFAFIIITLCVLACCRPAAQLEPGSWDPHVRESLNALMASAQPGDYAVFDFDKTSIVHDVSQALWVYQIEHLAFADAPAHAFLDGIPDPSRLLPGTSVSFAEMGDMLQTEYKLLYAFLSNGQSLEQIHDMDLYKDFRARMFSLLASMDGVFGAPVSYLWMPGLLSGFTQQEAREVIHNAIVGHLGKEKLAVQEWRSPDGRWGGAVERGIYFSPEMKDLFACLKDNGITPYVCSASLELIVEGLACDPDLGPGLPPEQVFGLRFVPSEPITAVYDSSYVQPIKAGKVSCIQTHMAPLHGGRGPVLVAGDSNGDVPMLTAFEDMRCGLIIDVGRSLTSPIGELAALARSGGARYLLQPAFAKADGAVEGGGI